MAAGRVANLDGLGSEDLGVEVSTTVTTNAYLQTNVPSIYAVGDVTGPYPFTHTAAHQARYAATNPLFAPFRKASVDYSAIRCATVTEPEIARVGLNELEALAKGIRYVVEQLLPELENARRSFAAVL